MTDATNTGSTPPPAVEVTSLSRLGPRAQRDALRQLASTTRVARFAEGTFVLQWDDVRALLRDRRFAGVGLSVFDALGIDDGPLRRWYGSLMFTNEGDRHARLRALVQQAFVPRSIEELRPTTRALAQELLAPVMETGEGDLVDFAFHLPIQAMAVLLGVPAHDVPEFTRWSHALARVFGFMTPDQVSAATAALQALLPYAETLLERRRQDPRDDLISRLGQAEQDGDRLTDSEAADMIVNLIVGGHDTSTGQIACTLLTLFEHPDLLAPLRDDPARVPAAVEEALRYVPTLGAIPRVALSTFEFNGLCFEPGALVWLVTDTANHDPTGYPDPSRFDPGRFDGDDAPRLMTFGAGPHFCLGAAFARMVVQEATTAVLALPPPLRLVEPAERIPWTSVLATYPKRLPARCTPTAAVSA
jgi:cytochrome P450